jgi:hypothetical protein
MSTLMITVFPRPNSDSCGLGCSVSCASCVFCGITCGFYEAELDFIDDLYLTLEEIGYRLGMKIEMEVIDTGNVEYSIDRLNMVLSENGEPAVDPVRYGEYMIVSAPLIAVNSKIVAMGEVPEMEFLMELVKESLKPTFLHSTSVQGS